MHLPQPVGREQRRANGVAMAHVVVAGPEAVGGEQLLDVFAQSGRFPTEIGAGDAFQLLDQVVGKRDPIGPIKRLLEQMAQESEHPDEHRRIAQGRVAAIHRAGWRQLR